MKYYNYEKLNHSFSPDFLLRRKNEKTQLLKFIAMKTFLKNDFYFQLFFLIAGVFSAIIGCFFDFGIMLFYFVVGIPQLISFSIRAFNKDRKSIIYITYGIFILPVWMSLLIIFGLQNEYGITNFLGTILIISLIYSPVIAMFYVYDAYETSKKIV